MDVPTGLSCADTIGHPNCKARQPAMPKQPSDRHTGPTQELRTCSATDALAYLDARRQMPMLASNDNTWAVAAGCFGADGLGADGLGAGFPASLALCRFTSITLKTSTLQPRSGRAGKVRYDGGSYHLNAIGLCNPGIRQVLDIHLRRRVGQGRPIGITL